MSNNCSEKLGKIHKKANGADIFSLLTSLRSRYFPANFVKLFRATFLLNTFERLFFSVGLRNLVSVVQFKKTQKSLMEKCHLFKLLATLLKVTLLHGCFSRFLNSKYGTKSCNVSHIVVTSKLRQMPRFL